MRMRFLGLVCLLLTTAPSLAGEWENAFAVYEAGQYDKARTLMTPLAEAGNVEAQVALANMYNFGHGVAADNEASAHWLTMAAKQNHPDAVYNLGVITMLGQGVVKDQERGWALLQRAAALDSPNALYVVGMQALVDAQQTGDVDTGLGYLSRSAQLGLREASAMLGVLLQDLPEVELSLVKSAVHFQIAIARGCDDLATEAADAVARLSPAERNTYESLISANLTIVSEVSLDPAHCLAE